MHFQTIKRPPAQMYAWPTRTLYLGPLEDTVDVAYGAATLVVSLEDEITVRSAGVEFSCYSCIVPGGWPVSIRSKGQILAVLHLDVLGIDFKRFSRVVKQRLGEILVELKDEIDFRTTFQRLYWLPPTTSLQAHSIVESLILYSLANSSVPDVLVDDRVIQSVLYIKSHFEDNIPIEDVASHVCLSVPRLLSLFKQQTGVPIRKFRSWHRIYESLSLISQGQNYTETALTAGFSDSPHFTKTFRSTWGISPSQLFINDKGQGICATLFVPDD